MRIPTDESVVELGVSLQSPQLYPTLELGRKKKMPILSETVESQDMQSVRVEKNPQLLKLWMPSFLLLSLDC